MKKTLLALVLTSVAATSFAYQNIATSADGKSRLQFGAELRSMYEYNHKTYDNRVANGATRNVTALNSAAVGKYNEFTSAFSNRIRFTLRGDVFVNPRFRLGFYTRVGKTFSATHYNTENPYLSTANSRTQGGSIRTTKTTFIYQNENGHYKYKTHDSFRPQIDRLSIYFESFDWGKFTLAITPSNSSVANQNQGAADNNDYNAHTEAVDTPYTALSDGYLLYADFQIRYDLTTAPFKPYRFAISYAQKKTDTYASREKGNAKVKYDNDVQVSFGWRFDRNNFIYLNAVRKAEAQRSTYQSAITGAVGIFGSFRPFQALGYDKLATGFEASIYSKSYPQSAAKDRAHSFVFFVRNYDTGLQGLNVYAGLAYKKTSKELDKSITANRTLDNPFTKEFMYYVGVDYTLFDQYRDDPVTLRLFTEVGKSTKHFYTDNRSARSVIDRKVKNLQVVSGVKVYW